MRLSTGLLLATFCFAGQEEDARLKSAAETISEIMGAADKAIPQDLYDKAECMVIVPGMKKAGFIFGGKYGRGFATCRHGSGRGWGSPAGIRVEGGSFGLQIGGQESDVILLVMNKKGMDGLLSSKFSLGGDVSAAAGPVGREATAQTDATMRAEILSYSRARGVFGGLALTGGTIREDGEANKGMYGGQSLSNKEILTKNPKPPASAGELMSALNKYSGRRNK
jgi:lipid-binding SYLF domain-containing protein